MQKNIFGNIGSFVNFIKETAKEISSEETYKEVEEKVISEEESRKIDESNRPKKYFYNYDGKSIDHIYRLRKALIETINCKMKKGIFENYVKFYIVADGCFSYPSLANFHGWLVLESKQMPDGKLVFDELKIKIPGNAPKPNIIGDRLVVFDVPQVIFPDINAMEFYEKSSKNPPVSFRLKALADSHLEEFKLLSNYVKDDVKTVTVGRGFNPNKSLQDKILTHGNDVSMQIIIYDEDFKNVYNDLFRK